MIKLLLTMAQRRIAITDLVSQIITKVLKPGPDVHWDEETQLSDLPGMTDVALKQMLDHIGRAIGIANLATRITLRRLTVGNLIKAVSKVIAIDQACCAIASVSQS